MDEVLDQVAIAFEEDGVNHSVLDELKKVRWIFIDCLWQCLMLRSFDLLSPCWHHFAH